MARELYNWDQVRAYIIITLYNLEKKNIKIDINNATRELDTLQTSIGYANRILNNLKNIK